MCTSTKSQKTKIKSLNTTKGTLNKQIANSHDQKFFATLALNLTTRSLLMNPAGRKISPQGYSLPNPRDICLLYLFYPIVHNFSL